jgi:hypothetical protein
VTNCRGFTRADLPDKNEIISLDIENAANFGESGTNILKCLDCNQRAEIVQLLSTANFTSYRCLKVVNNGIDWLYRKKSHLLTYSNC